jgi:hypothetical protein
LLAVDYRQKLTSVITLYRIENRAKEVGSVVSARTQDIEPQLLALALAPCIEALISWDNKARIRHSQEIQEARLFDLHVSSSIIASDSIVEATIGICQTMSYNLYNND